MVKIWRSVSDLHNHKWAFQTCPLPQRLRAHLRRRFRKGLRAICQEGLEKSSVFYASQDHYTPELTADVTATRPIQKEANQQSSNKGASGLKASPLAKDLLTTDGFWERISFL